MTIVVTATSGHLGHLVVEALLARDVPADRIIATARDVTKIVDLAERGVRTARADYADPASLREAFRRRRLPRAGLQQRGRRARAPARQRHRRR